MLRLSFHKFKRSLWRASARVVEGTVITAIVLVGGLGSSWYMVEAGSRLTTLKQGPWLTWTAAARPDADPYTRAHFANAGTLPVSAEVQRTHVARTDQSGERLHSSCDYSIEGLNTPGDWWSLAVFDERGKLIANPAERYAFTRDTIAASGATAPVIVLSREARSGNWLPTGRAGPLALVLTVIAPRTSNPGTSGSDDGLPSIRKLKCR
jgi:hypothetical protein